MRDEGYYGDCRDHCDDFSIEGAKACEVCAAIMRAKEQTGAVTQ